MSTQSEAKAHPDSMAGAARSYHEQEERIARLEAELYAALAYIAESPCDPDITHDQLAAWEDLLDTLGCSPTERLSRNSPTGSGDDNER